MPLCKHCSNLGLKTADTHWLREGRGANSKIVCPELLKTTCRFCKQKGHTIGYCPELKKKDEERISKAVIEYNPITSVNLNNQALFNYNCMFDSLDFTNIQPMDIDIY